MGFRMGEEPKTCRRACVFIELFIVDTFLHSSTGTVLPTNVASSPSAILPAIITTFTTTTTCYCTSVLCTWRYASIVCTADDTCIVRTCLDPSSLVFLVLLSVLVVVPQSSSSGSVRSFDGPCRVFDRSCFYSIILFDLKFTIFSSFFIGSEEDYFDAFFPHLRLWLPNNVHLQLREISYILGLGFISFGSVCYLHSLWSSSLSLLDLNLRVTSL